MYLRRDETGQSGSPGSWYMNPLVLSLFFPWGSLWFFEGSLNVRVAYFRPFSSYFRAKEDGFSNRLPSFPLRPKCSWTSNQTLSTSPPAVPGSSHFFIAFKSSSQIAKWWTVVSSPFFLIVFTTPVKTLLLVVCVFDETPGQTERWVVNVAVDASPETDETA